MKRLNEISKDNVFASITCRDMVLRNDDLGRIIANFLTFREQFVMIVVVRGGQKVHGDMFDFLRDESRLLRVPQVDRVVDEFLGLMFVRSEVPKVISRVQREGLIAYDLDSDKISTISRNIITALGRFSIYETKNNVEE